MKVAYETEIQVTLLGVNHFYFNQFWLISELFSNLNFRTFFQTFSRKFRKFENSVFYRKISELRQPNISETRENKKFGKFRLTQPLIIITFKKLINMSQMLDAKVITLSGFHCL